MRSLVTVAYGGERYLHRERKREKEREKERERERRFREFRKVVQESSLAMLSCLVRIILCAVLTVPHQRESA